MTRDELIKELFNLSIEDREFIVHEIWSSIGRDMGYDEDYNDGTTDENHIVKEPEAAAGWISRTGRGSLIVLRDDQNRSVDILQ